MVRLSGDWLGSHDELVPIRSAARSAEAHPAADRPPAAEDFWGEASAAVQDALQAPAGSGPRATNHRAGWGIRARTGRLLTPRRTAIAAGLIASLTTLAWFIGLGSPKTPSHSPLPPPANGAATGEWPVTKASLAAGIRSIVRRSVQTSHSFAKPMGSRPHRVVVRHRLGIRPHHRRASAGGSKPSQTFVSSPTQSAAGAAQQSDASSSQNAAASSGASSTQTPSNAARSAPAGPTGSVSLIGAGTSPSG